MKWSSRGACITRFLYGDRLRRSSCGVLDEDSGVLLYIVEFGGELLQVSSTVVRISSFRVFE